MAKARALPSENGVHDGLMKAQFDDITMALERK
ncbi:MAG: hypothetical protein GPOALKHO_001814 [Sodalis sp.]|nr:MAG: hypothetical protein GPOALKHO_001814 [Sodalis sp.]